MKDMYNIFVILSHDDSVSQNYFANYNTNFRFLNEVINSQTQLCYFDYSKTFNAYNLQQERLYSNVAKLFETIIFSKGHCTHCYTFGERDRGANIYEREGEKKLEI